MKKGRLNPQNIISYDKVGFTMQIQTEAWIIKEFTVSLHDTQPSFWPLEVLHHYTFLENSPPTPPLTQRFLTCYHSEQNVELGEG